MTKLKILVALIFKTLAFVITLFSVLGYILVFMLLMWYKAFGPYLGDSTPFDFFTLFSYGALAILMGFVLELSCTSKEEELLVASLFIFICNLMLFFLLLAYMYLFSPIRGLLFIGTYMLILKIRRLFNLHLHPPLTTKNIIIHLIFNLIILLILGVDQIGKMSCLIIYTVFHLG